MNVNEIRKAFPVLEQKINGKPIIYFDSACMSLKPKSVVEAMNEYYYEFTGCAERSDHTFASKTNEKFEDTRQAMAKFVNAKNTKEIVFTRNATESLNVIAHGLDLKENEIVIATDKEHNSNLIPWLNLIKEKKIKREIVSTKNGFDLNELQNKMKRNVKIVSVVATSNLDGSSMPLKEISKIVHDNKAILVVDAAQAMLHQKIDVRKLNIDLMAFSGHKMLGPTGTGILYGKEDLLNKMKTYNLGGHTVSNSTYENYELEELPSKFEAGLQDYAGFIGLGKAIEFLNKQDFDEIESQEIKVNKIVNQAIENTGKFEIIGPEKVEERPCITSFYPKKGKGLKEISLMLNSNYNIMIRSGMHCVHSWFNENKIKGSMRVSLALYNSVEEAVAFEDAIKRLSSII